MNATDTAGNSSGWQELGTWSAYAASSQVPTVDSITPGSGLGMAQSFQYSVSDVNGFGYIGRIDILLNGSDSSPNGCDFSFYPPNEMFLLNDAGTAWTYATLGSSGTLSNSQCQLSVATASMSSSANDLTLNLPLTFTSGFSGGKNHYVGVLDHAQGYSSVGPYGTWTVAAGLVASPTFSLAGGSYSSAQSTTISSTTPAANIRYTTNGTTPTETTGTVYSGSITVNASQTLSAIAYKSGWADSPVASVIYTISGGTASHTIQTSQAGLSILVDSVQYSAPQTFQWIAGSVHSIAVSGAIQPGTAGVQYSYDSWSDLGGQSHSVIASANGAVYTANFTPQYYLTMTPPPNWIPTETPEGSVYPVSGWYNAGSAVQVSAIAAKNFVFTGFTGGVQGSSPQVFTISQPTTVTSTFAISQLTVTTPTLLPSGKVGIAYSQQLGASGGIPPYTWHVLGNTTLPQFFGSCPLV